MAFYKYQQYLTHNDHRNFDTEHAPGDPAPDAGIYRCMGCGHEIGLAHTHRLPPQNHHQHTLREGLIRWKLVAGAQHTK